MAQALSLSGVKYRRVKVKGQTSMVKGSPQGMGPPLMAMKRLHLWMCDTNIVVAELADKTRCKVLQFPCMNGIDRAERDPGALGGL